MEPMELGRRPGFIDFVVTCLELVGAFATTISFFTINKNAAEFQGELASRSNDEVQDNASVTLVVVGILLGGPMALTMVCCSRPNKSKACCSCLCGCNSKLHWFYHPYYSASVQVLKLVIYVYCIWVFGKGDGFIVKTGAGLMSAIILASCDVLLSLNTILEVQMETRSVAYPAPKTETKIVFISLWKDLGIISSFVRVDELYFLLAAAPVVVLLTYAIRRLTKVDSQSPVFHLFRVVLIGAVLGAIYAVAAIRNKQVEYVMEFYGPGILAGAEIILVAAEMGESCQGRTANAKVVDPARAKEAKETQKGNNNNKMKDKKDKVEPQQDQDQDTSGSPVDDATNHVDPQLEAADASDDVSDHKPDQVEPPEEAATSGNPPDVLPAAPSDVVPTVDA